MSVGREMALRRAVRAVLDQRALLDPPYTGLSAPTDFDQRFRTELRAQGVDNIDFNDLARGRRLYESPGFRVRWAFRSVLGFLREEHKSDPSWAEPPAGCFEPKDPTNDAYELILPHSDLDAEGLKAVFAHDRTDPDSWGVAVTVWIDVSERAEPCAVHVGPTVIARTTSGALASSVEAIRRTYPDVTLLRLAADLNGRIKSPTTLLIYIPLHVAPFTV